MVVGFFSYQTWTAVPAKANGDNLTLPASVTGSSSTFVTIGSDAIIVSGYSEIVRVVISSNNADARFKLTTTSDLAEVAGYANETTITAEGNPIAFEAEGPDAQTALRGLQYKSTPGATDTISIDISPQGIASWYDEETELYHYYSAVEDEPRNWSDARVHSRAPVSLGGSDRVGWMATIGSANENQFVTRYVKKNAWMGAFDDCKPLEIAGDTTHPSPAGCGEGKWFWVPEAGDIGGIQFMTSNNQAIAGKFNNWANLEPNDHSSGVPGEDAGQFYHSNSNEDGALWNDLPHATNPLDAYIWEYASATAIGGLALTRTMSASTPAAAPANSAVPTISGTAETGSTLTAAEGTWTTGGSPVTATTYQWKRIKSGVTTDIAGANAATLCVPNTTDVIGSTVVVTVTKTNGVGSTSATSVATGVVAEGTSCPVPPAPPAPASTPTVVTPPAPAPVTPRIFPPVLTPVPPSTGPVLRNNQAPTPPAQPSATIGGTSTPIQTEITGPGKVNMRAGVVNLGVSLPPNQGTIRQGAGSSTELEVSRGGSTTMQGSGLLPGSTVQVFLPFNGSNSREIAQIPVSETGTFQGDAVFGATPTERPLPIGRHVLQVVTIDENRQQAVVEMTINIAQPAAAPEIDRVQGVVPTLRPGQSIATNAGEPELVTVTPDSEQGSATIEGDGWTLAVQLDSDAGGVEEGDSGGAAVTFVRGQGASVSGEGFMPGTRADVWLFSEPTLLGSVQIDDSGAFNGVVNIDGNVVAVGEHTLQLQGVGEDGFVRAANLGVSVEDAAAEVTTEAASGFLWWLWLLVALGVVATAVGATAMYRRATR